MSSNQRSLDEVVLAYIKAWSTPDGVVRRELLDISLADDASYTGPMYEARGKEELADLIGRSLSGEAYEGAGAGARIPISSGVDQHHEMFRFSWVLIDPQERLLLEGMDFVQLAGDGRLQRVVGFFGPFSVHTRELARTLGVAGRVMLLSSSWKAEVASTGSCSCPCSPSCLENLSA